MVRVVNVGATHQTRIALCVHHAVAHAKRVGAVEEDPLAALGSRLAQDHCSGQVWVSSLQG